MHKEHGTTRGSNPVHIGDLCMGLISRLHCSNHWQTPCVRAPYPIHYASVTNDLNCVWAPLYPFMYTLGHQTFLAPPGLCLFNLLTDSLGSGLLPHSQPS